MSIEALEERRAARREEQEAARLTQYEADLEALDAAEQEYGHTRVATLAVPFEPGLPTLLICRAPEPKELKRYKDRIKNKPEAVVDATDEMAACCRIYPELDVYSRLLARRPGVHTQLGGVAVKLTLGLEAAEGKG